MFVWEERATHCALANATLCTVLSGEWVNKVDGWVEMWLLMRYVEGR